MIPNQIVLPRKVAFNVVIQGFRIRFGRSVVTVLGVVLGIAFLMSILSSQALRKGVVAEDEIRLEISRMLSFLRAEMGPPEERTIGLILTGSLNETESRLILELEKEGLGKLKWSGSYEEEFPIPIQDVVLEKTAEQDVGQEVSAILIMGSGPLPNIDWINLTEKSRQKVLALSRKQNFDFPSSSGTVVDLWREMRPEEIIKAERDMAKEKVRSIWIITISLIVTIIGISNAMLMSVSERFREIGTMKCLGALSAFVRIIFIIESGIIGSIGGILGCSVGVLFSFLAYTVTYGISLAAISFLDGAASLAFYALISLFLSIAMSILAAIYPASVAARMVPADALRSNV